MKNLILIFAFVSFNSWAGYVAGSKVNQCTRTDYSDPSLCQSSENEVCYKVPNDSGDCGVFKFKDIYGTQKFDGETCEGKTECELLLTEKTCSVNKWPLIDAEYTEVYCVEVTGKELVIDTVLKAQKDAAKLASAQYEGALNLAKKLRECGGRVMDLMLVRNQPKNLTTEQVKQLVATYASIQGLLSSGSLNSAKEEIAEVTADGILVTNGDKAALTSEIDKCLGL